MKARTLLAHQRYFGLDPVRLRIASGRMMARVVGLPPERARVSTDHIRIDFGLDIEESERMAASLVGGGLLRPHPERPREFFVTERLVEYAAARVVEPLLRPRAKLLLDRACDLATQINREWLRNPLEIDAVAVSGSYMTPEHELTDLALGVVVGPRLKLKPRPWAITSSKTEGAREIRHAFDDLSSFVVAHVVTRLASIPRPFSVAWEAEAR